MNSIETASIGNLFYASERIGTIVGSIGVMIIFIGCLRGLWFFLLKIPYREILLADIRIELGHYLALGLEFLVAIYLIIESPSVLMV